MNRIARRRAATAAAGREQALVHRLAGLLLEYPTPELIDLLPHVREATAELTDRFRAPLEQVIEHLETHPLTELEPLYVETFDLKRRCALYLTYYAYGDTRKRGVALVEFKQAYRAGGFEMVEEELPDHLGVVLEFASDESPENRESGIRLLLAHRAGLELLRLALSDMGSPYAGAVVAVTATLPPLEGEDRQAVAKLAAQGPPGEDVGLEPYGMSLGAGLDPAASGAARRPVDLPMPFALTPGGPR